jgi:hypothetical protein
LGGYGNTQVAQYLLTNTGNIRAGYFTGNGSLLTGITGTYGNANVFAYLQTYQVQGVGNITANGITIYSSYIVPELNDRAALITLYDNGNITAGNITTNTITVTDITITNNISFAGTVTGNAVGATASYGNIKSANGFFWANGVAYSTGAGGSGSYSNANVELYLPTYPGNLNINNITANVGSFSVINGSLVGNVTGNVNGVSGVFTNIDSAISNINSNVNAANVAISTLQSQVFSNANVAVYHGNISPGNIIVGTAGTGNMTTGNIVVTYVMKLASLSDEQISAITPANGMMVYNTTFGNIQAYTTYLGRWGNLVLS